MNNRDDKVFFKMGIIDGIPIALGYLAVAFSLGIQAKQAGMNAFSATLMSFTNVTSAGEFAALTIVKEGGTLLEMAVSQLIINMRYLLMSCSLSQKIDSKRKLGHRFGVAFGVTDEIFGISYGVKGKLNPFYSYGAMFIAIPAWALGTCLGVLCGNILPEIVVTSMGVALYGMFIAIVAPVAKDNKKVAVAVIVAMIASYITQYIPVISELGGGTKIIMLTVLISLIFAIVCPVEENK